MLDGAQRVVGDAQANADAERLAVQMLVMQVGQKAAAGLVVGVADVVAGQHALAGDRATSGHGGVLVRPPKKPS